MRAAGPGLAGRHRRAHAEGARLVGRGGHHAAAADAADDDRLAAQRRLVALLHGGEERVQVDVEDRRVGAHSPMMPPATPVARQASSRPQPRASPRVVHRLRDRPCRPGSRAGEGRCHDRPAHGPRHRPGRPPRPRPGFLGFHPEDSVVLSPSATPASRSTPASTCPATRVGLEELADLPRPGRRQRTASGRSRSSSTPTTHALAEDARRRPRRSARAAEDVGVVCAVRADGERWCACSAPSAADPARRTTSRCHPFDGAGGGRRDRRARQPARARRHAGRATRPRRGGRGLRRRRARPLRRLPRATSPAGRRPPRPGGRGTLGPAPGAPSPRGRPAAGRPDVARLRCCAWSRSRCATWPGRRWTTATPRGTSTSGATWCAGRPRELLRRAGGAARLRGLAHGQRRAGVVRGRPRPGGRARLRAGAACLPGAVRRGAARRCGSRSRPDAARRCSPASVATGPRPQSPRLRAWAKRWRSRSSPARTARGTARRCAAASTCSRGCCASRASTPTTR